MILRVAMSIPAYEDLLDAKGVRLARLGLNDIALRRDDAITAIGIIGEKRASILGGDVYFVHKDRIDLAYANWYVNKDLDESIDDFCLRSLKEARAYIKNFPNYTDKIPAFSFVLKVYD
jgi:hypothetical protein